jgi:hypothetical protein
MEFLKRLFGGDKPARVPVEVPPGWRHTLADLHADMSAGRRKSINRQEMDWAYEYERRLIPPGFRFPAKGDVYEALEDQPADYYTEWAAPYSGGGKATIFKGERVRVQEAPLHDKPVAAGAAPVKYKELEARIVPEEERLNPKYGYFRFWLGTVTLNTKFKLVGCSRFSKWF